MIDTALLVVDVQRGLFTQKTPVYNETKLLDNILKTIEYARNNNIPLFFIQHSNKNILKKYSEGWNLHTLIKPKANEEIIHKSNGSAFNETNLNDLLVNLNIKTLIILGLTTHGCVKATCNDALKLKYKVILVKDAHSSFSEDAETLIDKWNNILENKGCILKTTSELVE